MPLNVRDASSVGQSWFVKTKVKKTNYIYDGGEDYIFCLTGEGRKYTDTLIVNERSRDWTVVTQPISGVTFVNPSSAWSSDQIMLINVDIIEFSDKTVRLDGSLDSIISIAFPWISFTDEDLSTTRDDSVVLGAKTTDWHWYVYRGGYDKIEGRRDKMEAIIINDDSSEYTINETSAGVTFVNPESSWSRDGLELTNIDVIHFNDETYVLEAWDRDFSTSPQKYNRVNGTKVKDKLIGTNGNDKILGRGGADVINGRAGDDLIDPGEWTSGKFDKVKGGKGEDTFVIKDGYWAFIKDFDIDDDKLDISGLSEGLNWAYKSEKKKTFIYGDDDYEVARFKGELDLSRASFI